MKQAVLLFTVFVLLFAGQANATCTGQFDANKVCGTNAGAGIPGPITLSAGNVVAPGGTVLGNNTTNPADAPATALINPILGIPGTSTGTLGLAGSSTGTATITPQSNAGTPTLTLPNTSGTFAVNASAPLALDLNSGQLSITGVAGEVLANFPAAFTATPVLGVPGSLQGTLGFAGSGSGTVTIVPQTAAGTITLTLPNTAGTFADGASSPLVLNTTTGQLTCPTCVTGTSGALTAGTTPTSGYSNTQILGSNGSVLSVYSVSGTGSVALTTSPSFTTPTLGAAVGSSLALGGATLGSNAFAVTGTASISSTLTLGNGQINSSSAISLANGVSANNLESGSICIDATYANCSTTPTNGLQVKGASALNNTLTVTSNSANALDVGPNGAVSPTLQINAGNASAATGLGIVGNAAGSGAGLVTISSAPNEGITFNAKGSGSIIIGGTSTGNVAIGAGGGGITLYGTVAASSPPASSAANQYTYTVATGTFTLGTSAIASGACATVVTVAGSGIATTDVIDVGFNADPTSTTGYIAPNMLSIIPYPTSGNANVKVCNNTVNSITPSAMTLNWRVRR